MKLNASSITSRGKMTFTLGVHYSLQAACMYITFVWSSALQAPAAAASLNTQDSLHHTRAWIRMQKILMECRRTFVRWLPAFNRRRAQPSPQQSVLSYGVK